MMPVSTVIVLSCDVMALIVMLMLLYALIFENSEKDKKTRYFIICCIFTILSLVTDIPAWYYENKAGHDTMLFIVNILSLVFSLGAVACIPFYEIEIIGKKDHVSAAHPNIIMDICIIAAVLATVGAFTGKTFTVENGVFTYGPWYSIIPVVSLVTLLYMEVLAVVKSKYLGLHSTLAFLSYMILPLVSVVIEIFHPEISLALAATALSSLLLYVMLQSGHVSALNLRGDLLNELSYKDMMTGLQNRRAYNDALIRMSQEPVVNVIFCDINGLKYTNDTLGHQIGDQRIISFGNILKMHFSYDSIFRISGDEFVVIIPRLSPASFMTRLDSLKNDLAAPNDNASVGSASGSGAEIRTILNEAEALMYEDKKQSYVRHPEYIR